MPRARLLPFAAFVLAFAPVSAGAYVIDGQLDAEYGTPTIVQSLQTELNAGQVQGDNNLGQLNYANGSEIDAAWAFVTGDTLHLFVAGNLALVLNVQGNRTIGHILDVFVDSAPGGFSNISAGPGHPINGLTFDAGFEPDYWFEFYGDGDQNGTSWFASRGVLPPLGPGTPVLLGVTQAGGPGTLAGGTNPFGVRATIDNRNTAGVTFGCGPSSGAGVTKGIEWSIPLAAIGSPEGCFDVAMIIRTQGATQSSVSNQVLGPLPNGTCALGSASSVNFGGFAGNQFFEVCRSLIGVPSPPVVGAGVSLALLGANPLRAGDAARFAFQAPGPASLTVHDARGRAVRSLTLGDASGVANVTLAGLRPGIYWARLSHNGVVTSRAFTLLPR